MRHLVFMAALSMLASACAEAGAAEPHPDALVPIVVAARDLPAGTVVTFDDLLQRGIPARLVTSSIVKPESASYVVQQPLMLPLLAGDPVQWSFFQLSPKDVHEACAKFEADEGSAAQQVARARQIVLSHGR
ncbi:MAG TPA: SAF domain-containing protein [Hyalangium sp.]|nr:SAF domain-containing protein [Hyalangium sp.]